MTKIFEKVFPDYKPERIHRTEKVHYDGKDITFTVALREKGDSTLCKTISITKEYIGYSNQYLYVVDGYNFFSSYYKIGRKEGDKREVIHENYMNKELDLIWEAMEEVWGDISITKYEVFHIPTTSHNPAIYSRWHSFNDIFSDDISSIEYTFSKKSKIKTYSITTVFGEEITITTCLPEEWVNWDGLLVKREEHPNLYFNLLNQTYYIYNLRQNLLFTNSLKDEYQG